MEAFPAPTMDESRTAGQVKDCSIARVGHQTSWRRNNLFLCDGKFWHHVQYTRYQGIAFCDPMGLSRRNFLRSLVGCGSTEILRVATAAFLGRDKKLIVPVPTFEAIEQYAKSTGCQITAVPLNRELAHDLDATVIHTKGSPSLVYICNPNNPTATL